MRCLRAICILAVALPVFAQSQLSITTTSPLPAATLNVSYSQTFQATGGITPYTWVLSGGAPPGLTLSASGTLSGTPTQTGGFTVSVSVSDSSRSKQTAVGRFSLAVQSPPLTITSSSVPNGTVGVSYSASLTATGGAPPYSWYLAAGTLPAGLSLSAGGQISGTPTTAGTSPFTIGVTDSGKGNLAVSAEARFSITIQAPRTTPLTITSASPLLSGIANASYSTSLAATGGTAPYNWSVVSGILPSGFSASSTGRLNGRMKRPMEMVAVSIAPPGTASAPPLAFSTASIPSGTVGVSYLANFAATGGSAPYNFATTSSVGGLTLSAGGQLSGTPTVAGNYNFTVQVTDTPPQGVPQQTATKTFALLIAQPLTVTTPSPINASLGTSLTVVMTASGGTSPGFYLWQVASGSQLPPGFTLDTTSGFLSGTPTTTGTFNFTVQVSDRAGNTATKALVLIVGTGITITTASPAPNATAGVSYSLTFAVTGGSPPLTWTVDSGTLPAGLSLNGATGVLSGTPQSAGTATFVIRVTDSAKATATKSIALTISPAGQGALISAQSLAFTALFGGNAPATQSFTAATATSAALQFTIAIDSGTAGSAAPTWLSVLVTQGSTPARIPVAVDQTGLQPGSYAARILINTSDGHQSVVSVTLTVITALQQLDVSPGLLRFSGSASALAASEQDLLVRNLGGGGPLAFQASVVGAPAWLSVIPASGQAGPNAPVLLRALVNAQGLGAGAQNAVIAVTSAAGSVNIPVSLFVRAAGPAIGFDLTGVQFEARQGAGDSNTEAVNVLNLGSGAVNWQAQVVTGGQWLSISGPATGLSIPPASSPLTLTANSSTLAAGAYYALISISDPNSINSPQFFTAVLNVDPATAAIAPQPDPEGLFFVAKAGSTPPPPQNVNVFASSLTPVAFQASASTTSGGNWLSVSPANGTTSTQATGQVSVAVNPLNLKAGIYTGEVAFALSSTSVRSTNVTVVVQPFPVNAVSDEKLRPAQAVVPGCTPAKLALAPTSLANSFAAPAGWPTALAARLADDCGSPVLNGQVVATFSNGDPALTMKLTDSTLGVYSATWAPSKVTGSMTMTAHASAPNLAAASIDISGAVTANQVPVLATNGTLNYVNPVAGAPLAPGTVSQISGSSLASASAQPGTIPAPTTFNGTQVLVGGYTAPLYSLSSGQLTVQLPNELAPGMEYPIVVAANGGYTLPDTITTAAAAPGVFVYPDASAIAEHMDSSLVNADFPASQNETIQIFLVGMGATDTQVVSGVASPSNPPANVLATPTVTVGGQQAPILFAGLVPGGVGVYQITFTVPAGLGTGYLPLVISQNGVAANRATLPVH